ncbi:LPS assembly lipoprotein LptE [Gemmata sp. JC717]|uniref:LPS assembly lipoprotein LptE n=1 Tax=Gemmata algarum TaxID=2975278 RepID=UPI0021BA9863|nr:LPS assembly lipoprotein LptE [Gemmata algarum]MDY3553118.1 LPS assembly lipoprotein LptE [Gemmata algarum]
MSKSEHGPTPGPTGPVAPSRRQFLAVVGGAAASITSGCQSGFRIFGYDVGAGALYDQNIRTVYVPLFNNREFQTTPYRGFEVDVTQAVIREIGKTTAFRVTSDPSKADTELLGNVVMIQKMIQNLNQQNQIREAEIQVAVDVVWRDLRDGTILSNPRKPTRPGLNPQLDGPPVPFDPNVPVPPDRTPLERPELGKGVARILATGRLIPELGETNASASKRIQDQIAVQIVSMMEKQW